MQYQTTTGFILQLFRASPLLRHVRSSPPNTDDDDGNFEDVQATKTDKNNHTLYFHFGEEGLNSNLITHLLHNRKIYKSKKRRVEAMERK